MRCYRPSRLAIHEHPGDLRVPRLPFPHTAAPASREWRCTLFTRLLLPAGKSDEINAEILATGNVEMEYDTPEHKRWSIALLKWVYLALCIKFGVIEGEWADQVRADLLAAHNAPSRADVPASEIARRLHVLRRLGTGADHPASGRHGYRARTRWPAGGCAPRRAAVRLLVTS